MSATTQNPRSGVNPSDASLQAVITTAEFSRRGSRRPDYEAENSALAKLMVEMVDPAGNVLQELVDTALSLCRAHSAGISILEEENGRSFFRWRAVAGKWSGFLGGTMPRNASPCGTVLDRNGALLMSHLERCYALPPELLPPVAEVLLAPFHSAGKPVGTVWVVAHDESRKFDGEDLRLLTSLANFAAAAHQAMSAHKLVLESEDRFRKMIDALPAAIYTTDTEGRLTHFNPASVELSGRVPELGTDLWCVSWRLYRPDGTRLPHDECPMAIALKEGKIVHGMELIAERPDGKRIWVVPFPTILRDGEGRIAGGVNMLVDVTERKRADEGRARLAAIVDSSDDAIVGKTLEGIITSWNRGAEKIFGYTEAEAVGRHISLIIPEDRLSEEESVLSRLRRGDKIDHFETERRAKDGRKVLVSLAVSPIRDSSGMVTGAAKVARDITDAKRAEEQLRQAQKLESIGILAGGIAHDFNNLLTGILGNASLALDLLPQVHPLRELLDEVVRASQSAAHLTQQMLAYAGKGQFVLKSIDLSELVREIATLVQASIPHSVRLRLDLGNRLPRIDADASQLQQLIMNLAINGAEAIGEGKTGTVRVSTRVVDIGEDSPKRVFHPQLGPGRYVSLEVHDDGCGMDEKTLRRVFDPFFSTKFLGRGLGLAAAQGIVRSHKGAIGVSSAPGEGSTFEVLFPAVEAPAPPKTQHPAREASQLSGVGTILVVDDEEIVRTTAAASLRRYGYQVLLAEDGQRAVELFEAHPEGISLVLLDLTMPVMSGEETLERLQALRPEIPVILTSGYNQAEAFRRFRAKKLAGFIQKPYTAPELAEKIKAVLA